MRLERSHVPVDGTEENAATCFTPTLRDCQRARTADCCAAVRWFLTHTGGDDLRGIYLGLRRAFSESEIRGALTSLGARKWTSMNRYPIPMRLADGAYADRTWRKSLRKLSHWRLDA